MPTENQTDSPALQLSSLRPIAILSYYCLNLALLSSPQTAQHRLQVRCFHQNFAVSSMLHMLLNVVKEEVYPKYLFHVNSKSSFHIRQNCWMRLVSVACCTVAPPVSWAPCPPHAPPFLAPQPELPSASSAFSVSTTTTTLSTFACISLVSSTLI